MASKWYEARFLEALESGDMKPSQILAVKRLYEYSEKHAEKIVWGQGKITGSINPRFAPIVNEPIFTLRTNGHLRINYGLIKRQVDEGQKVASLLSEWLNRYGCFSKLLPNASFSNYPELKAEDWAPCVDEFISFLDKLTTSPSIARK